MSSTLNSDIVYAAVFSYGFLPGGVYKSTDGGLTWEEKNNGLTNEDWDINDIMINPRSPQEFYIGTSNNPLFKSINGGDNWFEFKNGLPDTSGVSSLAIDPLNDRIYAGVSSTNSSETGIYIYDGITSVNGNFPNPPLTFVLYPNFPNPFNPITIIHYQVAKESWESTTSWKVTLAIFNLLGQKVKTLLSDKIVSGDHYVAWDGRNDHGEIAGSGIYFLKMVAQSGETRFVETQKLILMK